MKPRTINPLYQSRIPTLRTIKVEDVVGHDVFAKWVKSIDMLVYLALDYIDTVCDLCIQMKIHATKHIVRRIREFNRYFEQDRSLVYNVDDACRQLDHQNAEEFQDCFEQDFRRLFDGIELEVNKLGLNKDYKTLIIAVQQALTIMDALKLFCKDCDAYSRSLGYKCEDLFMMPNGFDQLYTIVPLFAGDSYQSCIHARKLTAVIIVNRIKGIELKEKE